jgi:hypothetical protein
MYRHHLLVATLALAAMLSVPAAAQALQSWTQVGSLSCKVNPNIGFIIFGHQPLECLFTSNEPTPPQAYDGAINTVGLNVGISAGGVLGWAVFAPTTGVPAGVLAGEYVGVSGDIGIGLGDRKGAPRAVSSIGEQMTKPTDRPHFDDSRS